MVKLQYLFSIARSNASAPVGIKENPNAIWTVGCWINTFSSVGHFNKNIHIKMWPSSTIRRQGLEQYSCSIAPNISRNKWFISRSIRITKSTFQAEVLIKRYRMIPTYILYIYIYIHTQNNTFLLLQLKQLFRINIKSLQLYSEMRK
jgi:hypothetical protein